ncbi:uncharacterized protein LOC129569420 [Sitodiplosis mosellana]|uniref:uncharacterized protein LOC129569420 n=1 Tax=Sitodiplosis mosellana TaxID=263140 RepID=UPI002444FFEB|nr:uncharacterized protein LOC129569420 [Sitodiplosis mosellana]
MPEISNISTQQAFWSDPCDWHNLISTELREYILERVFTTLLRNIATIDDLSQQDFSELTELAKWIECQSFITAISRGNYYRLLDMYLGKTQPELKENYEQYKEERRRNLYLIEHPKTKPWHESFSTDLRKTIISTFVEEIIPTSERSSLLDESEQRLLMLASRSEVVAYGIATSRAEYYNVLGKKIGEIKSRIDSLMQHVRGRQSSGITSSTIDIISQPGN